VWHERDEQVQQPLEQRQIRLLPDLCRSEAGVMLRAAFAIISCYRTEVHLDGTPWPQRGGDTGAEDCRKPALSCGSNRDYGNFFKLRGKEWKGSEGDSVREIRGMRAYPRPFLCFVWLLSFCPARPIRIRLTYIDENMSREREREREKEMYDELLDVASRVLRPIPEEIVQLCHVSLVEARMIHRSAT
jgi:hypothetical protein